VGTTVRTPDGVGLFTGVTGHLYAVRYPEGIPALGMAPDSVMGYSPIGVRVVESEPVDVWLKFDTPEDEESAWEANTYPEGDRFYVAHYHTGVGLVTRVYFDTYAQACAWLTEQGFQDFSS